MVGRLRSALAWVLSATLALAPVSEAVAQSRNSFRPIFQPGGGVSSSTNKPVVGATTATGQVPAGASANCKRNGSVTGSASVTPQGAVTCTFGSALIANDTVSIPWTLTGESPAAVASVAPPAAPVNTVLPAISGTAQVGQTLTASQGTWSNTPTSYAYVFAAGGAQVQSGSSNTYVPVSGDVGKAITATVTATNGGGSATATSAATGAVTAVPVAAGAMTLSNVLAYSGSVYTATVLNRAIGNTTSATSSDGTPLTFTEGIATQQPGVITGTFTGNGNPSITITNNDGSTTTQSVIPITVQAPPAVASVSDVLPAAQKFATAYAARQTVAVTANPGTITAAATTGVPNRVSNNIATVPEGYSSGFGNGSTWIYGNTLTGQRTYAMGGSKRFRYGGRYLDLTSGAVIDRLRVRIRPFAGGAIEYLTASAYSNPSPSGTTVYTIDLGSYADRIVELIGGEVTPFAILGSESGYAIAAAPDTAPRTIWFNDSYVFGQGAIEVSKAFVRQSLERVGVYDVHNQGFRTNAWARIGGTQGTHPMVPDRLIGNPWGINEATQYGAQDLVVLTGTINDNTSDVTRLYNQSRSAFLRARATNPGALILFILALHGPDSRAAADNIAARRQAFNDALGSDPGALMADTVAENWIPPGAVGSSPYFPDANGDYLHPTQAGHDYFSGLIAQKLVTLFQRVISASGGGGGGATASALLNEDASRTGLEDGSGALLLEQ